MTTIDLSECTVDLLNHRVRRVGVEDIPLTPMEVKLLEYLHVRPGVAVPTTELLRAVWGYNASVRTRAVNYAVNRLRSKIERNSSAPEHLVTVRGVGFRFEMEYAAPARLVGRRQELAEISQILGEAPAVALTGAAGAGKTTLALAWAEARGVSFCFCDATNARDKQDLLMALALAMEMAPVDAFHPIVAALRHRGVLLVVDNAERVVAEVGELVVAMETTVLITSRTPVPGVPSMSVRYLPQTDAVRLFNQEACKHTASWVPQAHRASTDRIVQRLQGSPLALVLAAHGLRWFTPEDLDERLQASLELLEVGASPLSIAIARSLDLLDTDARVGLAWMSGFQKNPRITDVEAVLGRRVSRPLAVLAELEQYGLVRMQAGAVEMTVGVREAAVILLATLAEEAQARAVRTDHFVGAAAPREAFYELMALQKEHATMSPKQAQRVLVAGADLMPSLLHPRDIHDRIACSRTLAIPLPPLLECLLGWTLWRLGDSEEAAEVLARSERRVGSTDYSVRGQIWRYQGGLLQESGRCEEALRVLLRGVDVLEGAGLTAQLPLMLNALAIVQLHAGHLEESEQVLFRGLEYASSDPESRASLLNTLGNLFLRRNEPDRARRAYTDALQTSGAAKRWVIQANLASVLLVLNERELARDTLLGVVAAHRHSGRIRSLALSLGNLGRVQHLLDELDPAIRALQECSLILESVGDRLRASWFRLLLSTVLLDADRNEEAARSLDIARSHERATVALEPGMKALLAAHVASSDARRTGRWDPVGEALGDLKQVAGVELRPMLGRLEARHRVGAASTSPKS